MKGLQMFRQTNSLDNKTVSVEDEQPDAMD